MKQRLLVIGGDSFIAGKFIEAIYDLCDITIISRKSTNKPNAIICNNLFDIPNIYFQNKDTIINFAAIVHQPKLKDENLYNTVNHLLPTHLANKAKDAGIKHFIQLSTIAVYGEVSSITNQTQENPNNLYGKSKLSADIGLIRLTNDNFRVSIIRPPMVYGGGLAPGNMLNLLQLVKKGYPLPFKNINNKRHFININNLIRFLILVLKKDDGGIFVPTDRDTVSTEALVKIISEKLHKKPHLFSLPKPILKIISLIKPNLYNKLFGSLEIKFSNHSLSNDYQISSIHEGIKDMVNY